MLNLDKFAKIKKERDTIKKKCYKKVLKKIISYVEINISQNLNWLIYEMEPFILGEVEYDMLECINYIIEEITIDSNFKKILEQIQFYEPNIIYIKWNIDKINSKN